MTTFFASIFVFGLLIVIHELGHFMVAKLVGIKVYEFSLGFGPKLASIGKGETAFNLRAVPLGGFVRMAGTDPKEELDEKDIERGFNRKTVGQRAGVIFAGPLMNFILAVLILAATFALQGQPVPSSGTGVGEVLPGYPAQEAGIVAGDKIVAIDNQPVDGWVNMVKVINDRPGETISVAVIRDGTQKEFEVKTVSNESGMGMIGIYPEEDYVKIGVYQSIVLGVKWTVNVTVMILDFLSKMIFGQAPADVGGPVRVVSEIGKAAQVGFPFLLRLSAFLSINLGLFNLLPIPALDGSRILFLGWEKVRGRPVDPVKENFIHFIGFGLLLLLMLIITYNDILQIFMPGKLLPGQ